MLKVAILAEKYAADYTWYVDVILNLIRIAGDYVSEEVWYRVIQIVVNREDVQGYAAKTVFEVSSFDWVSPCALSQPHDLHLTVALFFLDRPFKPQLVMKTWSKLVDISLGSLETSLLGMHVPPPSSNFDSSTQRF